jgi:anti-sigma regulatory factor (Ser/Thr protein kinase)
LTASSQAQDANAAAATCAIGADVANLRRVAEWLGAIGAARGMGAEALWRLDLCATEVLANVIAHGGASARTQAIELRLEVSRQGSSGEASLRISDSGCAFDPCHAPLRLQARTLAEAEPGGQGLVLLRRFADALDYRRSAERNHLTICVRWSGPE